MTRATYLGNPPVGSPEWHELRVNGLGGSEVAAALGLSPWCSPFTLWHRKRGLVPEQFENQSMTWGKRLEPVVRDVFREQHPEYRGATRPAGVYARGWQVASPDCFLAADALLEVKTADSNDAWKWGPTGSDDPDAIPPFYRVQALWYGDVLDVRDLWLAVLIGGNDYREYRVPWSQDEVDDLRGRAHAFWRTVVDGIRPDLDGSSDTYDTVRQLHPDIDRDHTQEIPAALWEQFTTAQDKCAEWSAAYNLAKSLLTEAMGTARYAAVDGRKVARRQSKKGGVPYVVAITQTPQEAVA